MKSSRHHRLRSAQAAVGAAARVYFWVFLWVYFGVFPVPTTPRPVKFPLNRHNVTDTSHTLRPSVVCEVSVTNILVWEYRGGGWLAVESLGWLGVGSVVKEGQMRRKKKDKEREGDE